MMFKKQMGVTGSVWGTFPETYSKSRTDFETEQINIQIACYDQQIRSS